MRKTYTARLFIRDAATGAIVEVIEVTAHSKFQCKRRFSHKDSNASYYRERPDQYTISAITFI